MSSTRPPENLLHGLICHYCGAHCASRVYTSLVAEFGRPPLIYVCEHSLLAPKLECVGRALRDGYTRRVDLEKQSEIADRLYR